MPETAVMKKKTPATTSSDTKVAAKGEQNCPVDFKWRFREYVKPSSLPEDAPWPTEDYEVLLWKLLERGEYTLEEMAKAVARQKKYWTIETAMEELPLAFDRMVKCGMKPRYIDGKGKEVVG